MKQRKAFTIIEVVLVLAIAGLIFLMVFIALPALQRSQRNTRRRQDISRVATAVNDYQANNNKLPFPVDKNARNNVDKKFVQKYISDVCTIPTSSVSINDLTYYNGSVTSDLIGKYDCSKSEQFVDPDGTTYNLYSPANQLSGDIAQVFNKSGATISFEENHHVIIALAKAKCSETENKAEMASGANNFALFYMLEGGAVYCVDNQ